MDSAGRGNSSSNGANEPESKQKLEEVSSRLRNSADQEQTSADYLTHSRLAASLFGKAPVSFLESHTSDELVAITMRGMHALEQLASGREKIVVEAAASEAGCTLVVGLGDCPFVINTITECLQDFEAKIAVLLHPLLLHKGVRYSLTYIQLSGLSSESLHLLRSHLRAALELLLLATGDFPQMLVQTEALARSLENAEHLPGRASEEPKALARFLRWLSDGALVFLGHVSCTLRADAAAQIDEQDRLGILRSSGETVAALVPEMEHDARHLLHSGERHYIAKLRAFSPVHRRQRMLHILIRERGADESTAKIHCFLGLLTSKALGEESSRVPLIDQKLYRVLEREQAAESSHDYKTIVNILDRMPKDDALRLEADDLLTFVKTVLSLFNRSETRVAMAVDPARRGVSILVAMSRDRFTTQVRRSVQNRLEEVFGVTPGGSEYFVDLSRRALANMYFYVPLLNETPAEVNLARLQEDIAALSQTWIENLRAQLESSGKFPYPEKIWHKYYEAFPQDYQALRSAAECERDILMLEQLSPSCQLRVMLASNGSDSAHFSVSVYARGDALTVSQAVPVLENAGLEVIGSQSSLVRPRVSDVLHVQRFIVRSKAADFALRPDKADNITTGLEQIFSGAAHNDELNSLMLFADLSVRQIALLRTYCSLLWQLRRFGSRTLIYRTLTAYAPITRLLWLLFQESFNPESCPSAGERSSAYWELHGSLKQELQSVTAVDADRTLRDLLDLIDATVRTNFYAGAEAIVIKLNSERVTWMPAPRPKFEFFVSAPAFEAVHLRSDMVARGGLRWSERRDDFRSEVLGLMKTQKIKNAVIVPAGAKGGFVLNNPPSDPSLLPEAVVSAYRGFIRAILSISDNLVNGEPVHPPGVVCLDGYDPYLVVAADKGTATFSDVANEIAAKEFNFWLGDGFASGGSFGYDHKRYGITARGAWECVKRHFNDIGLDYEGAPFTVVGIGDMSGDVFGNGLLMSSNMKLLAAFDHRHVFVDPDPDPAASFSERKRLFETPRSKWSDYNPALISKGGGVFARSSKEIRITPEMRSSLSIPSDVGESVNGEQLITLILRARCDLLWNGGIGTYVKASTESNTDVGDSSNDGVRVNGADLRAKVVGEGGNLGFTQRGRIEFALRGGRINTDAIDNSGGVDLSDHEVNLKILFGQLIALGKLDLEERNRLLEQIAQQIVEDVLQHNRNHATLLTLGTTRSSRRLDYFRSLISEMHRRGFIDRRLENLPDDEELVARSNRQEGLSRPELAVVLASVKMWMKHEMAKSRLLNKPLLDEYLLSYFPRELRGRFGAEIMKHPLADNIKASQLTNRLVDLVGISFFHRMCLTGAASLEAVVRSALASDVIFGAQDIRRSVCMFDNPLQNEVFLRTLGELNGAHRYLTFWLHSAHKNRLNLQELIDRYRTRFRTFVTVAENLLQGEDNRIFTKRVHELTALGLDADSARCLAITPVISLALETIWAACEAECELDAAVQTIYPVLSELTIVPVLELETKAVLSDRWEKELAVTSYFEIRHTLGHMALLCLRRGARDPHAIRQLLHGGDNFEQLLRTISDIRLRNPDVAALAVLSRQLRMFYAGLNEPSR